MQRNDENVLSSVAAAAAVTAADVALSNQFRRSVNNNKIKKYEKKTLFSRESIWECV